MVKLDGKSLGIAEAVKVLRFHEEVTLCDEAKKNVATARALIEQLLQKGEVVYGITTGFGKLADVKISQEKVEQLQENLILSHSAGVGTPLDEETARGIMLLRANALMKGHSGIRIEVIQLLVDMLNTRITPLIPSQGSVGASGDLVQLAHMVLPMLGYGEVLYKGSKVEAKEALEKEGLKPVTLKAKEGLALINGTQCMGAFGLLAVYDAAILLSTADLACGLALEALRGIPDAFDEKIHALRPHPGQMQVASNIRRILAGSQLVYGEKRERVQDAYSLRCAPQVHGASRDALSYVQDVIQREINSATDNPLVFPQENEVLSAGNFHGQPLALALDFLGIAVAEIANISERRIERMVNPALSGLPPFLSKESGLHSGYMIAQYTAASLVSENKVLAHPASVDSIPTSANQEDHVSMGTIAARKLRTILDNALQVVAIELLTAAQGMEFSPADKRSPVTCAIHKKIREHVPSLEEDRVLSHELATMLALVREGSLLREVESLVGAL